MQASPLTPPGSPGLNARWTSSAKSGVGTSLSGTGRVWFTLSHGILNEVYYPRVDTACTRDFGLLVTGPDRYFSEEKRETENQIDPIEPGVPLFHLRNLSHDGRYVIEKTILTDPRRPVLLQSIVFQPLIGKMADYRVYALLAPHLMNAGNSNTAWVGDYKGTPMLFATSPNGVSIAVAASAPWLAGSAGYVGVSDGWQNLSRYGQLETRYQRAENGNVSLAGEIDLNAAGGQVVIALAFGSRPDEAAFHAISSLQAGVSAAQAVYMNEWHHWQSHLLKLDNVAGSAPGHYRTSTSVLATHQQASAPGATIASLSIPWGFNKGDEDLGGYHLIWPRDLVETAGGFLAAGAVKQAKDILGYLQATQEGDGHWSQNMWLDGSPYWGGVQMDECAFPILLADMLQRGGHFSGGELDRFMSMILRAAIFVVANGPVTSQDRWEEDAGYSPFTLAVEIAGLLAAADLLELGGHSDTDYLRETADTWNDEIERWTFATDTPLCREHSLSGYYVRIAPPETSDAGSPVNGFVPIKNRSFEDSNKSANLIVSPDALALVRFGLRAADDPRIVDTVRAIDALLKKDLPQGPVWYRYNGDGYGEHADGAPFDGIGVGRPWPLLTGERAHYELAAGNIKEARDLLTTFEASAGQGRLLPEQVWDDTDIAARELFLGKPSGSAMPLVWAHSEHIKLLRSLTDGAVFDMPPQPVKRYQVDKITSRVRTWRFNHKARELLYGKILRIEVRAPATVRWTTDDWKTITETPTVENAFSMHVLDLSIQHVLPGDALVFTFYWRDTGHWEQKDYTVLLRTEETLTPSVAQAAR
jgi:glucoamylase